MTQDLVKDVGECPQKKDMMLVWGTLTVLKSACCGHGVEKPFVIPK